MKAVIFDMDGVIIDSEPLHQRVEADLLKELGGEMTDKERESFVGTTDEHLWSWVKEKFNVDLSIEEMIQMKKDRFIEEIHTVPLVDGVKEILENLKDEGYLIALASSNNRQAVDKIIAQFELGQYLEIAMSGEDVKKGKPNPEMFLKTAEAMQIDPKECLVIEDARNGVVAAKKAGMKCIAFDNPNSGKQDLSAADLILEDFDHFDLNQVENLFR